MTPGVVLVRTAAELRSALATGESTVNLFLPAGARFDLGGAALVVLAGVNATLSSQGEVGATLDGEWRSRIFEVRGTLTLSRLHLTRGLAPTNGSLSGGGAIAVGAGSSLLLLDSTVSSSATATTAVAALAKPDGSFLVNFPPVYAALLASVLGAAQEAGEHGGGIAVAANATAAIVRSTLANNSASLGGAISNAGGRVTVSEGAIASSSAIYGAGISVTQAGELVVLDASISDVIATGDAGAVLVSATSTAAISGCSFADNHAEQARTP